MLRALVLGFIGSAMLAMTAVTLGIVLDVATSDEKGPLPEDPTPAPQSIEQSSAINSTDTGKPDLDAIAINEESMDDVDMNALPRKEVAAPKPTLNKAEQEALNQTISRASDILTEDLRLRDDAADASIALWIENSFRATDTDTLACVEDLFIDGGGKIDEVLTYCSTRYPTATQSDDRVAALDAELDENQNETAVVFAEPE